MITGSVMSDLHLEHHALADLPGSDILILSGDTWSAAPMRPKAQDADSRKLRKRYIKFCEEELSKYKIVFLVLGNHEYYGGIFEDTPDILRDFLAKHAPHAVLLNDEFHEWEGVRFVGSTLWGTYGYNTTAHSAIQIGMNDFHLIRTHKWANEFPPPSRGRTLLVSEIYMEHFRARVFLHDALEASKLPCVVITHHAPSYMCLEEMGLFQDAYASNQHSIIDSYKPVMWTYGHTHDDRRMNINGTLVISNQRGYFGSERCARFFEPSAADFTLEDVRERKLFTNGEETNGTAYEAH